MYYFYIDNRTCSFLDKAQTEQMMLGQLGLHVKKYEIRALRHILYKNQLKRNKDLNIHQVLNY